ncbi:MAG: hypothetical protein OEZ02_12170 [Anaerolineae bacterium]|nr:hypothetical protein [Anaerolineae bacterium]
MKQFGLVIAVIGLAGCATVTPSPIPTETMTATIASTPTIVWFPPTATLPPSPTVVLSATPDMRPGLGSTLLEDDFSSGEVWSLASANGSSAAVANGRLVLALSQPTSFLFTTRQLPIFGDFYAEITASPSLCSGADEYGVMVRVTERMDYYRFSFSCDGRVRVDRIYQGAASSPIPWMKIGAIPATAPSSSRMAVWAFREELRFFVNGFFLFGVRDTLLYQGALGVFVRTAGDSAITVSFTELVVREVDG